MRTGAGQAIQAIALLTACVSLAAAARLLSHPAGSAAHPIVFTQAPAGTGSTDRSLWDRAEIAVLFPDGTRKLLTPGFHSAADPEVSFDGKRLLFAGRKRPSDNWNIYEMAADGSGLRQITSGAGNFRQPLYLSTLYTLISEKPWHQIAFVGTLPATVSEKGLPASALYSCRLDGTSMMRLTHNPSPVMDPFLMDDGRILFASLRRLRPEQPERQALFAMNIDGTDFLRFADDEGRAFKSMPCVTTEGLVVFVEPDAAAGDGAGCLSSVTLRRNLHSYRPVTQPADGRFHSPSPMPDGTVLVARRPAGKAGTYGIYRLDPGSGAYRLLFDDPARHELQPRILAPRAEPDGRSTSVLRRTGEIEDPHVAEMMREKADAGDFPKGRLYCLDSYISTIFDRNSLPRGTVKRVRVLEGVTAPGESVRRRFLGEAPVHEDGSFNLQVPADIPIELQLLDADGLALETCGWIWVKNNEPRGCIGCHEDGELVPENRLAQAIARPSVALTLPPARRRAVDFERDIRPVIEAKCTPCHRAGGTASPWQDAWVTPGSARTSPLIWSLFGRNTSRPWDGAAGQRTVRPMPPSGSPPLSGEERRTLIEWIDTGARRNSRPAAAGPGRRE
jgi:hypothetical protein